VRRALLLTGLFLGLAVATRWSAAYPAALIAGTVVWRLYGLRRASRVKRPKARVLVGLKQHRAWVPVAIIALPFVIYWLAYVPFFSVGHGFDQFLELQRQIYGYHTGLEVTHAYGSPWWSWPLALRPVRYVGAHTVTQLYRLDSGGNPLHFWAFVAAVAIVCRQLWAKRDTATLVVLCIGFLGQWLPWALVGRVTFLYHFTPAVPFVCLAVGMLVGQVWHKGVAWRVASAGYVLAVAACFAYFYPIYSMLPLSPGQLDARLWLDSWR